MKNKTIIFLVLSTILRLSSAYAMHKTNKPLAIIRFKEEGKKIYILCKINQTDSLKFLFDTEASNTMIKESIADTLLHLIYDGTALNENINSKNEIKSSSGNTISLGKITIPHLPLYTLPYRKVTMVLSD